MNETSVSVLILVLLLPNIPHNPYEIIFIAYILLKCKIEFLL